MKNTPRDLVFFQIARYFFYADESAFSAEGETEDGMDPFRG